MTAAPAPLEAISEDLGYPLEEAQLNFPPELIESMTTEQVTGLLLLRMRALLARGFAPSEALFAAARLEHVQS